MLISELETPAVIVDLDVMERNLSRMADYCRAHQLLLRPHTKSHKIPDLAKRQIASGATGITVAKLGEAEVMVNAGITDILIAYPIVGDEKTTHLAKLAEKASISVALDSAEAARGISGAATRQGTRIGVLIEMDVGFGRCGLGNENDLLSLAQTIATLPGLEFRGLMFFPGHFGVGPEQRAALRIQVNDFLDRSLETFARAELPLSIVSGGSTPTAYESSLFQGVNEVRPGMYIFNDRNTVAIDAASLDDCALSVVVTVVSTAVRRARDRRWRLEDFLLRSLPGGRWKRVRAREGRSGGGSGTLFRGTRAFERRAFRAALSGWRSAQHHSESRLHHCQHARRDLWRARRAGGDGLAR